MAKQPSITAADLAKQLDGKLEGDGSTVVCEVETLDAAGPDALSWIATDRLLSKLAETKAGIVLVPKDCQPTQNRTLIRVSDPDASLCRALELLAPPLHRVPPGVHSSATLCPGSAVEGAGIGENVYVGSNATVESGSQLHPGVYVGADARIGRDCVLWPGVVVRERVQIGDRVVIHPNTTIGADGFGYLQRDGKHVKIPQVGTVVVEDDVEIGANSTIDRARSGTTRIGRGTKIDNLVHIAHNCEIGENCIIVAQCGLAGSVTLGRHVMLGGQVGISDHLTLGSGVHITGKSSIFKNVPDGRVLRGNPAMDNMQFLRQEAAVRKLPDLLRQVKNLQQQVEQLQERLETGKGKS